MRAGLLLLVALLAVPLVPAAGAQEPLAIRVEAEPLEAPIAPLRAPQQTTVTVDAPCLAASPDATRPRIVLWLEDAPTWATLILSASSLSPDPTRCEGGRYVETVALVAAASDRAPAFAPAVVKVHASWEGAVPNLTGTAEVALLASYFSILESHLVESVQTMPPGGAASFPLVVTNLGNDRTRVVVERVDGQRLDGLTVLLPEPFVLESRQKGGEANSARVFVEVLAEPRGGFTNEAVSIALRIRSEHAERPELGGDVATLSVLATVQGFQAPTPGPGLLAVALAFVAAAALARRARR